MPFVVDKSKSKKGLQYQRKLAYLTQVQWDISDLLFVLNMNILIKSSKIS